MAVKLQWSAARDAQIRDMRQSGASWDAIAARLGLSRNSVLERGRHIGARLPPKPPRPDPEDVELQDFRREPLAIGHPVAWGAITRGTWQDGDAYPWPPLPMQ